MKIHLQVETEWTQICDGQLEIYPVQKMSSQVLLCVCVWVGVGVSELCLVGLGLTIRKLTVQAAGS